MQLLRGFFLSIGNDIAAEMVAQILQLKILKQMCQWLRDYKSSKLNGKMQCSSKYNSPFLDMMSSGPVCVAACSSQSFSQGGMLLRVGFPKYLREIKFCL
jgi:hypothetical protein